MGPTGGTHKGGRGTHKGDHGIGPTSGICDTAGCSAWNTRADEGFLTWEIVPTLSEITRCKEIAFLPRNILLLLSLKAFSIYSTYNSIPSPMFILPPLNQMKILPTMGNLISTYWILKYESSANIVLNFIPSKVSFIRYSLVRIIRLYVFFKFPCGNTTQFLTYSLIRFIHIFVFCLVPFEKRINETLL